MAIPLTMDETLLCLDFLFQHGCSGLHDHDPLMLEFSKFLQQLPIIPQSKRKVGFRSPGGLHGRIRTFNDYLRQLDYVMGKYQPGDTFHKAYQHYKDAPNELHEVAEAIRRNLPYFSELTFGADAERSEFPEGALLGHLHRHIEQRDCPQGDPAVQCAICKMDPGELYHGLTAPLQAHLLEPITRLDPNRRYAANQYIWVCPNCHAALHQLRPWRTKSDCEEILR